MFRSYEWKWDNFSKRDLISIFDDDFQERNIVVPSQYNLTSELGYAVIKVYSERKLCVVSNLLRAFIFFRDRNVVVPLDVVIYDNKKHNTLYTAEYADAVDKCLVLL